MAATSKQGKILEAAIVRIRALALSGLPDESVNILKVDETGAFVLPPPAIAVFGSPTERIGNDGDNQSYVIYYPLLVLLRRAADDNGLADFDNQDIMFAWREAVIGQFWEKPGQLIAAGAPSTLCAIDYQPGPILDVGTYERQKLWQSRLQFWIKSKEIRTSG